MLCNEALQNFGQKKEERQRVLRAEEGETSVFGALSGKNICLK